MSKANYCKKHDFLKFLTRSVSGPRYYVDGIRLSKQDSQTVLWCIKLFYCILVDVRSLRGLNTTSASIKGLIQAGNAECIKTVLQQLDAADARLISTCEQKDKPFSYVQGDRSTFLQKLQSLMQPIITAWNTSRDVEAFKSIHQVNTFMKRLSLQDIDELKLVAFDGWYETERRSWNYELLSSEETDILEEWYPITALEAAFRDAEPRHGSGSTAEGFSTIEDKCLNLRWTHEAVELVNFVGREDLLPRIEPGSLMQSITVSDDWLSPVAALDYCLVCFVNKSWKTFRVISEESVNTMYWQQFVADAWEIWLRSGNCGMAAHYRIDTEWINRDLAWEGSLAGQYATIDLTSASDCVGYDLVKSGFKNTFLSKGLELTRSGFAVYEDPRTEEECVLVQKKYAPMGNRLCFPCMTTILCAVCEAIVRRHIGTPSSRDDYVVYGDDIVIRAEYALELLARLREIGFIPNERKSYFDPDSDMYYRESCGGEYLNGTDVTPLMISREFHGLSSLNRDAYDPAVLGATIEFANRVYEYRFSYLRLLLTFVVDRATDKQVWRDDGSCGLFSPCASNAQLDTITWDPDYQCRVGLALSMVRRHKITSVYHNRLLEGSDYGTDAGLAPVLLSEYLRLTRNRKQLTFPEDQVRLNLDPYNSPEITAVFHSLPD